MVHFWPRGDADGGVKPFRYRVGLVVRERPPQNPGEPPSWVRVEFSGRIPPGSYEVEVVERWNDFETFEQCERRHRVDPIEVAPDAKPLTLKLVLPAPASDGGE